ncbi:MAG: FAD-dependent oxidoreductase [Candidatus Omnitrophota bacterium]
MKNITILGSGIAGLALVRKIRAENLECGITLIDKDLYYFCPKTIVSNPGDISGRKDILSLAKGLKAEFINAKVEKINPKRKKIYFSALGGKAVEPLSFENLVITTGLVSKKLPIKGEHREGFFYLSEIDSFKLKDLLRVSGEAAVYVSTWLGIRLARALNYLGKEVKVVSESFDFLGEDKEAIINELREKNIVLYLNSFIEEAVGESMIKAIKISPLKVFSSQLLFVDSGFMPNLNFFEEEVISKEKFLTDFKGIYLLGSVNKQDMVVEEQVENFVNNTLKEEIWQSGLV